jgi:hypothetical protein
MDQPCSVSASGQPRLDREAVHAILRAARFGHEAYPGPIGELIERELTAYVETGRQLPADSGPERLLVVLHLAQEQAGETTTEEPRYRLPAVYKKGTPLHWELTPTEPVGTGEK